MIVSSIKPPRIDTIIIQDSTPSSSTPQSAMNMYAMFSIIGADTKVANFMCLCHCACDNKH